MTAVYKLPQAEQDLIDIWVHIALDSPLHADRYLDLLDDKMRLLASSPGIGRLQPHLAPGLRAFPVGSYLLCYRAAEHGIEVVRVLHAARDIDKLFQIETP